MKTWQPVRALGAWLAPMLASMGLVLGLVACGGGGGGEGTEAGSPPPAIPAAPLITTQPLPRSVADGAAVSFGVVASGSGLAYQWQRDGGNLAGATAATLNIPAVALADDGASYRVVVSNAGGSVTSSEVRLTVTPVAPAITTAPAAASVTAGQTASFTVVASGSAPLSHQWLRDGSEIPGATAASFTTAALGLADDGARFSVRVGNAAGSVTSAAALLRVASPPAGPQIVTQPQATSAPVGGTARFRVVATGTPPLAYQWRRNGADIAGATADSHTTPVLASTDNGAVYSVRITNATASVESAGATLTVTPAALASPLAGRAWTPMAQVAPSVFDGFFVGLADDGRAVVVGDGRTPLDSFPFARSTPFVVLGEPGGGGAVRWSSPQNLAAFGTRSGAAVPTDLRVNALRVAANGRAVILATGSAGGCPSALPGLTTTCRFVSVLDPATSTWSPWDVMAPLDDSQREDRFTLAINDRGDLALHFPAGGFTNPVARVFWRSASELAFRSLAIPGSPTGPQLGEVTLDEAGRLVLAAPLNQGGTTDIVVWRGSVAAGLSGPVVVDTRAAPASFRSIHTGRNGRSFLFWSQNNGVSDSLYAARFDAESTALAAEDLGQPLLASLPTQLVASVRDDDVLIAPRYIGSLSITSCATVRWPFAGSLQLSDAPVPCTLAPAGLFVPSGTDWGGERGGNVLVTGINFTWATYDADLNRQIDAPIDVLTTASGPGYVIGVRRPPGIRTSRIALSRSGIGLVVISANFDTWPTPALPNGDGRPAVANLWAAYFR
jgi:hypothetical protein